MKSGVKGLKQMSRVVFLTRCATTTADHLTEDEEVIEEEAGFLGMRDWNRRRVLASIAQIVQKLQVFGQRGWPSFMLVKLSRIRGETIATIGNQEWVTQDNALRKMYRSIMQHALALNVCTLRLANENYLDRLTRIVEESNVASEAKDERYWRSLATERDADGIEEEDFGQSEAHWTGTLGQWKPRDGEDEIQQLDRIV